MPHEEPYRRRSARILLLDGTGRLLLLRFLRSTRRPQLGYDWITPGGGVDQGETLQQAAARELHEEIGLLVDAPVLGDPVAHTSGYAEFSWARGMFRDDFFYHRVDAHEVDTSGMEKLEGTHHGGHRWWSIDELASTTETVYPLGLVPLLSDLLGGRAFERPVILPWHL
jgi:8-oxo-dGTP pyrophosphatase MutT (NUDIX family)